MGIVLQNGKLLYEGQITIQELLAMTQKEMEEIANA